MKISARKNVLVPLIASLHLLLILTITLLICLVKRKINVLFQKKKKLCTQRLAFSEGTHLQNPRATTTHLISLSASDRHPCGLFRVPNGICDVVNVTCEVFVVANSVNENCAYPRLLRQCSTVPRITQSQTTIRLLIKDERDCSNTNAEIGPPMFIYLVIITDNVLSVAV